MRRAGGWCSGTVALLGFACQDTSDTPSGSANAEAAGFERSRDAIGVQLFTLRAAMQEDLEGTLRDVARLGYYEVEFAGLFGHAPAEVRRLLAALNLSAVGSHVSWDRFRDDPDGVIEETLALGSHYLVFPWLPEEERQTLAQWQDWVALFNRVGVSCRERGLEFVYHNHDYEFAQVEGVEPYDLLLDQIDRSVVQLELDVFWLAKAGREPNEVFERYPGGFPLGHLKDMRRSDQAMVDVGQGDLDFAAVFGQAELSGMQHFIVEHDDPPDPMQSVGNSLTYLRQLRSQ
jgi:sugar phosphate isomerase/epimerase